MGKKLLEKDSSASVAPVGTQGAQEGQEAPLTNEEEREIQYFLSPPQIAYFPSII